MDAPIIFSDDEEESMLRDRRDGERPVEQPVVKSGFARLERNAQKPFATQVSQSAGDLIARYVEGTHIQGGY